MRNVIFGLVIISIIVVSGCVQTPSELVVSSSQTGQEYINFCQALSKCDKGNIDIKTEGTDDVYSLDIIGLNAENCEIRIGLDKAGTSSTSHLEGLDSTCTQKWGDFGYISRLNETDCRDYVNNLLLNIALDMKKDQSLCAGSLREALK